MKFDIEEIKKYIEDNPEAKIYLGCDSQKIRKRKRKSKKYTYITAVVIYQKDKSKIFYEISYEKDYDINPSKPSLRLMNEVYKVSEIITILSDTLKDRIWECHLDINPKETEGSNCVYQQAIGYIKGVHGVIPITKPDAFCSSTIADHIVKKGL